MTADVQWYLSNALIYQVLLILLVKEEAECSILSTNPEYNF